jgi:hypothetical protein
MRRVNMLTVVAAIVFVAAGSARGSTSPGPLLLDRAAVTASGQLSLPMMKDGKSLTKTVLPAAKEYIVAKLLVAATVEDGKEEGEKHPRSRSAHCPPDKDDHHDFNYRDDDHKGGDNQDKEKDKDKDHHENCGKGDDDKNP